MSEDIDRIVAGEDDPRCPDCGFLGCVCFDDDDQPEVEDDGSDECGMTPGGQCMLAGTEWCDWDCPRNKPARLIEQSAGKGSAGE